MTPAEARHRLDHTGRAITELVRAMPADAIRWKPAEDQWSVLEIVCHLADEERDDFRMRVRSTLEDPTSPWPPIDPPAWAEERHYNARDPEEALRDFQVERETSLSWLDEVGPDGWDAPHEHPRLGRMTARDVLAAWVAHDLLHLRQLARTHHRHLEAGDTDHVEYAGGW